MRLFLGGDFMPGRGVDQILPHSCPPRLYESHVTSALQYVELAERQNGPIPRSVDHAYVWGDALDILAQMRPDARIINLETSVTLSEQALPKGINYRMHPGNVPVLAAAGIDCSVLANNHVLDWDAPGLLDTLDSLDRAGLAMAGAGHDVRASRAPAILSTGTTRVLVFACGATDSGIPADWAATDSRPGVHLLPDFADATVNEFALAVDAIKQPGDIAIASIHWGSNWGFEVPPQHRRFAHALIERASIDIVHGHSSHHPRPIEVFGGRLILYGCGDLLDDYEGIRGYEEFRDDLVLMYFPTLAATGELVGLEMVPLQIHRFRLRHASAADRAWLRATVDRASRRFGTRVTARDDLLMLTNT